MCRILARGSLALLIICFLFSCRSPEKPRLPQLYERVPLNTEALLVGDLQDLEIDAKLKSLREWSDGLEPELKAEIDKLETQLEVSPEEFESWVGDRFYLAVLGPEKERGLLPSGLEQAELHIFLAVELTEPEKMGEFLAKKRADEWKEEEVEGVPFFLGEEVGYGIENGWLYIVSDKKTATQGVLVARGRKPHLAGDEQFQEALGKVGELEPDWLAYGRLRETVAQLLETPMFGEQVDKGTVEGLTSLVYFVSGGNFQSDTSLNFLRVEGENSFARALLTPYAMDGDTAKFVRTDVSSFAAVDLRYGYQVLKEFGLLFPAAREGVSAIPLGMQFGVGVEPESSLWRYLDGEVGYSVEQDKLITSILKPNFERARAAGQRTACLNNLKNLQIATEMWSVDHEGNYPESLSQLTPDYLVKIPECPAAGKETYSTTYKLAKESQTEVVSFHCSGGHHPHLPEGQPAFNNQVGLIVDEPDTSVPPEPNLSDFSLVFAATGPSQEKVEELIEQVLRVTKTELTVSPIEEVKVRSVSGFDLFGAVAKPTPALVWTVGEDSEENLLNVQSLENSLYQAGLVQDTLKWGGEGLISLQYYNLDPMIAEGITLMESIETEDQKESVAADLVLSLLRKVPSIQGATGGAVREDGIYQRSVGFDTVKMSAGVGVVAAILVPNFVRARQDGQLTACKSNLKNISIGLEMYEVDHQDLPDNLQALTPDYLTQIPACPAAGRDTYSESFIKKNGAYTLHCSGNHHPQLGENRPTYSNQ